MHEPRNAKEQIEKAFLDLLEEKPYMDVALRTKRKIFSYKIQKPLLKRNLKKDA